MNIFILGSIHKFHHCDEIYEAILTWPMMKCQLINFFFGQAKMAIYLSRKNNIESNSGYQYVII